MFPTPIGILLSSVSASSMLASMGGGSITLSISEYFAVLGRNPEEAEILLNATNSYVVTGFYLKPGNIMVNATDIYIVI